MRTKLKRVVAPVLDIFESGDFEYTYKRSHRTILIGVGALFLLLAAISLVAAVYTAQPGAWLPFVVFFCAGSVCEIVGFLGSDKAVAKIWGNRLTDRPS
ncbi:MAG: hypothetical protein QNJ91_14450 [Gammaproteobacteria bacterium]|nr:hypothetical protein [Gammaproteobacteria bacterium]